ncbi:MAG: response regulator [Deltaproteobacteria bacterium]|nr:response regulator [Deltaproteobacteria bacterium]
MYPVKILLVDDEIPFVKTLTKRLSRRELNIITAFSGQEALAQLKKDPDIEIIVLDIKMPGMNGLRTLEEIKRDYPLVEVIILTGHSTVDSAIRGMRLGAFDYLVKPCDIDQLISRMQEATEKKRRLDEKWPD